MSNSRRVKGFSKSSQDLLVLLPSDSATSCYQGISFTNGLMHVGKGDERVVQKVAQALSLAIN